MITVVLGLGKLEWQEENLVELHRLIDLCTSLLKASKASQHRLT